MFKILKNDTKEIKQFCAAMDSLEHTKKGRAAKAKFEKTGKPVTYKEKGVEITYF